MRILITGSRDWTNQAVIQNALEEIHRNRMFDKNIPNPHKRKVVLVSGHCPDGADKMCEWVAEQIGWRIERHPAQWQVYGRRAGYIRNAEMARMGADVCLAFLKDDSPGTSMMIDLAQRANIPTHIYRG